MVYLMENPQISFERRQRGTDTAALASNMSWELDILALNISITKR